MHYSIHATELFWKKFAKLIPANKQDDVRSRIRKLEVNPFVGKPLGSRTFREMKLDKFRIYYKILEEEIIVLLLSVSDKKSQDGTIDLLKSKMPELIRLAKYLKQNE